MVLILKSIKKVALSGMMCALSVLIMLIGSLFQSIDLTAAAAAGLTVVFAMVEMGNKYAFLVYAVSSVLALLLIPSKSTALIFTVFAGLYPILKSYLQKIKIKWLAYAAKILVFNLFFTVIIYVGKNLLGLTDDFYIFGYVIYLLGNIAFIAYDYALDKLIMLYVLKIKRIFDKSFRI